MSDLRIGMLVQHASLGIGKIVAVEPTVVHVYFAANGERLATKLRLPMARPLLSPSSSGDAWLAGLAFTFDAKSGRYARADTRLSRSEAVARFLEVFPKGFADPSYLGGGDGKSSRERASRWRRAHDAFVETLGNGEGERLLAEGDVAGLVERVRRIEKLVKTLQTPTEKLSLADALEDGEAAQRFFKTLFDLLAAPEPDQARFAALAKAVAALGPAAKESGWPLVTLLPFVAQPDRHLVLRPKLTCEAADRLGLELHYDPSPNAETYASLLASAELLLESLQPLGARDYVDVESFMHIATTKAGRAKSPLRLVT